MAKKSNLIKMRVSEIYSLTSESDENCRYLGFTICYPDRRIENVTMDFRTEEYEQVLAVMQARRELAIHNLQMDK